MYSESSLRRWQDRYSENIQWNWRNVVLPNLTPYEAERLRSVRIQLPVLAEGELRGDPFAIHSEPKLRSREIVLPIFTVKFLDDVSIAASWLLFNGYSTETLSQYVSMLRHGGAADFPGQRFPEPLVALGVPKNATDESKVDAVAQQFFKTTVIWVICHELGHMLYETSSTPERRADDVEQLADKFAMEMMRRIGVAPAGLGYYFHMLAHWQLPATGIRDQGNMVGQQGTLGTHPLTAQRAVSLARSAAQIETELAGRATPQTKALTALISLQLRQTADVIITGIRPPRTFALAQLRPRSLLRQTPTSTSVGPYAGVYDAYVQSVLAPRHFNQYVDAARLRTNRQFNECLASIAARIRPLAIRQAETCNQYSLAAAKSECYRANPSASTLVWVESMRSVLQDKVPWEQTISGQGVLLTYELLERMTSKDGALQMFDSVIKEGLSVARPIFVCD